MVLGMTNGPLHFRPGLGVRSGAMAPKYSLVRCAALVNSLPPRSHRAYSEGPRSHLSDFVPHRTRSHQPFREGPRSPPSHIERVRAKITTKRFAKNARKKHENGIGYPTRENRFSRTGRTPGRVAPWFWILDFSILGFRIVHFLKIQNFDFGVDAHGWSNPSGCAK